LNEITSIAVVEDDAVIRAVLEMALAAEGFSHVASYARGDEAMASIRRTRPDLVLLDVMLPGLDGFTICRRIRETPALASTRIVMLTARTQNEDIVRGLECGADDYVVKPFDRKVLTARIRAVLRRGAVISGDVDFDGLTLDEESRSAVLDGEELKLPPGEFRILSLLAAHRGSVLARERILNAVAAGERGAAGRTIDVQIANLRRRLGRWADHIETIRGVGYRVKP